VHELEACLWSCWLVVLFIEKVKKKKAGANYACERPNVAEWR
jgi:hypothetical protein